MSCFRGLYLEKCTVLSDISPDIDLFFVFISGEMYLYNNDFSKYSDVFVCLYLEKSTIWSDISPGIALCIMEIVGREAEISRFDKVMNSGVPEFLAMYGRRRVGKTFLIREYFKSHMVLDFSGAFEVEYDLQIDNFYTEYTRWTKGKREDTPPQNWTEAFKYITNYLYTLSRRKRIVLFIDELPWLDTPRSGFVKALEYFWNQHGSRMNNLVFVVCGSSASWMQNKLIKAKGGLHNRTTTRINLQPFTLRETELYLKKRKVKLSRYQIVQLYMVMGGIPHYLKELSAGKSATQLIDEVCFSPDGLLADEYNQLYYSLFSNADNHMAIVEALAARPNGLVRSDLVRYSGLPDGGTFTRALGDLIDSGFLSSYKPFKKKKKDTVYRLIDLYSLFYLKYIHGNVSKIKNQWQSIRNEGSFGAWSGYAYENVWMLHMPQLLKALEIAGTSIEATSWKYRGDANMPGAQIDLLVERGDDVIHICEVKFSKNEFVITKSYSKDLMRKRTVFEYATKTKKLIVTTLLTTYPAVQNLYYQDQVHSEATMNELFS